MLPLGFEEPDKKVFSKLSGYAYLKEKPPAIFPGKPGAVS